MVALWLFSPAIEYHGAVEPLVPVQPHLAGSSNPRRRRAPERLWSGYRSVMTNFLPQDVSFFTSKNAMKVIAVGSLICLFAVLGCSSSQPEKNLSEEEKTKTALTELFWGYAEGAGRERV
jgi:hypothetical protein